MTDSLHFTLHRSVGRLMTPIFRPLYPGKSQDFPPSTFTASCTSPNVPHPSMSSTSYLRSMNPGSMWEGRMIGISSTVRATWRLSPRHVIRSPMSGVGTYECVLNWKNHTRQRRIQVSRSGPQIRGRPSGGTSQVERNSVFPVVLSLGRLVDHRV